MRILRGLSSRTLTCGCTAGIYETYSGLVIAVLDARGSECAIADHKTGVPMSLDDVDALTPADQMPSTNG